MSLHLVVVGAGASNLKSTVALNVATAAAALGVSVALRDRDGASSRALGAALGTTLGAAPGSEARLPWVAQPVRVCGADESSPDDVALVVTDPPRRWDDVTRALVAACDVVLVPVDASPLAQRVLADVVAIRAAGAAGPRVRVVLARLLPRDVDRWALVEQVAELAPDALLGVTLPMARTARRRATAISAVDSAVLYAPGTAAARAYAALARELLVGPAGTDAIVTSSS